MKNADEKSPTSLGSHTPAFVAFQTRLDALEQAVVMLAELINRQADNQVITSQLLEALMEGRTYERPIQH